ncbi:MAG: hypothetical protein PHP57_05525 [Sideroxydans sp.]|nr:hypothetical protein [Sideroxydans sp.]
MPQNFACRFFAIFTFAFMTACSSTSSLKNSPTERVDHIVEEVRKATPIGFVDVKIDYVNTNLYVSGHAYAPTHVARLMRLLTIDASSKITLLEIHPELFEGIATSAFVLVEPNVGPLHSWSGEILLKYPHSSDAAEVAGDMIHVYEIKELVLLDTFEVAKQKSALIRLPDGQIFTVRLNQSLGKERAFIREIGDSSIVLIDSTEIEYVLRVPKSVIKN